MAKTADGKRDFYADQLTYRFCWFCGCPLVDKYHEIKDGKVVYCRDGTWPEKPKPSAGEG